VERLDLGDHAHPGLPGWAGSTLTGVTGVTPADCWARGMSRNSWFLAHWNGSRWSMAR
jgi:hypothetical protein